MAPRVVVSALLAIAIAAPEPVRAADALKPLRSLTYELSMTITSIRRTPHSGLGAGGSSRRSPGGARARAPTGEDAVAASLETNGSIVVDVVAATGDNGLVADIAENARGRSRPKVRFAITSDGSIGYDPKNAENVSEEELALARWLARGFYGEHPVAAGTLWTVDQSGNGIRSTEHYRVTSVGADHRVTLTYTLELQSTGVDAYSATREGSLVYDTALIVPLRAAYQGQSHRQLADAYHETHTSLTLTLTADSFVKKP